MRILTLIDGGPISAAVVDVAHAIAEVMTADVDCLTATPDLVDGHEGLGSIPIRQTDSDIVAAVDNEMTADDVAAVVLGIRSVPGGGQPAGHVACHVIEHAPCLVVAVPPGLDAASRDLRRLVVAVDGQRPPSTEFSELAGRLIRTGRHLTGVHVFQRDTAPAFADRWDDAPMWARQFWLRNAPMIDDYRIGVGDVAPQLLAMVEETGADALLAKWHQSLSHQHAHVIKHLLTHSPVPLLLLADRRPLPTRPIWRTQERATS